jgi:hypothetical protein
MKKYTILLIIILFLSNCKVTRMHTAEKAIKYIYEGKEKEFIGLMQRNDFDYNMFESDLPKMQQILRENGLPSKKNYVMDDFSIIVYLKKDFKLDKPPHVVFYLNKYNFFWGYYFEFTEHKRSPIEDISKPKIPVDK